MPLPRNDFDIDHAYRGHSVENTHKLYFNIDTAKFQLLRQATTQSGKAVDKTASLCRTARKAERIQDDFADLAGFLPFFS